MALDVYLQIDGIKGESMDDRHKDWIEVSGVHWAIHQPRSATDRPAAATQPSGPSSAISCFARWLTCRRRS